MQLNIFYKVIKENKLWILILYALVLLEFIVFLINPEASIPTIAELLTAPGNEISLITAFRNILLIYLVYKLYIYEINNNYIYIFNRISINKWFHGKIIAILILVIAYNLIYEVLLYTLFFQFMKFNLMEIINTLVLNILITFIMISLVNITSLKKYAPFIASISIIITFKYFKLDVFIILILILIALNYYLIFKRNVLKQISD